jgi:Uncharacterized protein conserved in bacteria (DUF2186).
VDDRDIIAAVAAGKPFADIPDVRVRRLRDTRGFDASFELKSGNTKAVIYIEAKSRCTGTSLEAIAPWIRRMKEWSVPAGSVVLACDYLPPSLQQYCIENGIDFIDLTGNVSINIPGTLLIRQIGRSVRPATSPDRLPIQNPFSSRSSRVLRVLLQNPGTWRVRTIAEELRRESLENAILGGARTKGPRPFMVDPATVSRVLKSLTNDLLVRRRGTLIVVAEPERLLRQWAERYAPRYRSRLRTSFLIENPFGATPARVARKLSAMRVKGYAFTGSAAATVSAPYVDPEIFDIFVTKAEAGVRFRQLEEDIAGPRLRVITPYDIGVFMYAEVDKGIPVVSPVQSYLDCWAAGGRERKQADYLLDNVIIPRWKRS